MGTDAVDPAELLDVVTAVVRVLRRAAAQSDGNVKGLSLTEFRVLKRLAGGLRLVRDLAVDLDVTVPTISAAVESLVRRGLVKRGVADRDRRVVPLILTDQGQSALYAARDRQFAALLDVLAVLDADERASLASSVGVLSRALLESGQRST